jgi:hypothetical protein
MIGDLDSMDYAENERRLQEVYRRLHALEHERRVVSSAEELEALEREIRAETDRLASVLLERQAQANLDSAEQQAAEAELIAAWPGRLKSEGRERVRIRTVEGGEIELRVRYYRRRCDRRRGKRYRGVYAGLVLMGIHERCTPWLGAQVSAWSALLSSFAEVVQVLADHGLVLGVKTVRQLSYRYAERARAVQHSAGVAWAEGDTMRGRRVVISGDGGRVRLREPKRGPKTRKGRRRYRGAWREPKLFIVYVVDAQGKLAKCFAPVLDGTLRGPDAWLSLLRGYLQSLRLEQADQVLFVADGAHWIWNRVGALVKALGLDRQRVHELIDFYHAVEHLGKVAALRQSWSAKERRRWVRQHRQLLLKGHVESVMEAVRALCRGRHTKAVTTERNYFIRHQQRMDYPTMKTLGLPLGSGAVESAIRRVVNLRLKGSCLFWYRENADKMLMLRSYYKAGRWNLLKKMANSHLSLLAT